MQVRCEHFAILEQYLTLSRKWWKRGPWLLWRNANRNSYATYRTVPFSMTVN